MIRENQGYWLRAVGLEVLLMAAETLHGLWRVKVLSVWLGDGFARDGGAFTGSLIILDYVRLHRLDSLSDDTCDTGGEQTKQKSWDQYASYVSRQVVVCLRQTCGQRNRADSERIRVVVEKHPELFSR